MIDIFKGESLLYSSLWDIDNVVWDDQQGVFGITLNKLVFGDLTIVCYEQLDNSEKGPLFSYWVHTAFLPKDTNIGTSETV